MSISTDEHINAAPIREGLYRLLALTMLRPPGEEIIDTWANPEFKKEIKYFISESCCDELELGLEKKDTAAREIKLAYDALFCVPIKGKCVTPYESVYRENFFVNGKPRKLLMGKSARAVEEFIRLIGLEPPIESPELPDHIGMELLLMSSMCGQEGSNPDEVEAWREWQKMFLDFHLSEWVVPLAEDIRERTSNHFIKAIAGMMVELVNNDVEYLGDGSGRQHDFAESAV